MLEVFAVKYMAYNLGCSYTDLNRVNVKWKILKPKGLKSFPFSSHLDAKANQVTHINDKLDK